MRFVYKIHSNYDGFRPAVIEHRMKDGRLRLGWQRYIDVVENGVECWVYFHGRHRFEPGVYAQGIVDGIDYEEMVVSLRVREFSARQPIKPREINERAAALVAPRYRQVFVWPEEWIEAPECSLRACKAKRCDDCQTWAGFPRIEEGHASAPSRLRWSRLKGVVPAYWIVPRRCFFRPVAPEVEAITRRFVDFKSGEMAYAYPFARAMFEQLRGRGELDFDYIVPIPLSPDKAEREEAHRTLALAKELGRLLGAPVREMLRLRRPVSKRIMQALGFTVAQFESTYLRALEAEVPERAQSILLVDDVMTKGSTVAQALKSIAGVRPEANVLVATAGQMIIGEAIEEKRGFKPGL